MKIWGILFKFDILKSLWIDWIWKKAKRRSWWNWILYCNTDKRNNNSNFMWLFIYRVACPNHNRIFKVFVRSSMDLKFMFISLITDYSLWRFHTKVICAFMLQEIQAKLIFHIIFQFNVQKKRLKYQYFLTPDSTHAG